MGEQAADVYRGHVAQLVIEFPVKAIAAAVVVVVAQIDRIGSVESAAVRQCVHCLSRFDVVDSTPVVVIAEAKQGSEFLLTSKTLAGGSGELVEIASAGDRGIASH